jgi:HSP20 family protein
MLARRNNFVPLIAEPVFRDFDRLFDALTTAAAPNLRASLAQNDAAIPPINIWHDDTTVVVETDLPGVTPDQLEIDADRETLTIRATRRTQTTNESRTETPAEGSETNGVGKRTIIRTERTEGRFERSITLPTTIDPDAVKATLKDGVLTVRLPRADTQERRRVQVTAD